MLFIVTNKCYGIENAAIVSHVRKYARLMQVLTVGCQPGYEECPSVAELVKA